jgi:hypothetical protein
MKIEAGKGWLPSRASVSFVLSSTKPDSDCSKRERGARPVVVSGNHSQRRDLRDGCTFVTNIYIVCAVVEGWRV